MSNLEIPSERPAERARSSSAQCEKIQKLVPDKISNQKYFL